MPKNTLKSLQNRLKFATKKQDWAKLPILIAGLSDLPFENMTQKQLTAREHFYYKVMQLAKEHGIAIPLTEAQKSALTAINVIKTPTWIETMATYASMITATPSATANNTPVYNESRLSQSTTAAAVSTLLSTAERRGQTVAMVQLKHADGTQATYTLSLDILRQLLIGGQIQNQSTAYLNVLLSIKKAIMQPTEEHARIRFITSEQMNQWMHQSTPNSQLITNGPVGYAHGLGDMPAIIEGPFPPRFVQPIPPHVRALNPETMLKNALEDRFLPLLAAFVTDLQDENAIIGDERIQRLHSDLNNIVRGLENAESLHDTESALDRMIAILDEAQTEFQYETGIWRFLQPILNAITSVVISIAACCSRPFMEQDAHQAFVEKWSTTYDSTAQRIYKTSQASAGFFSRAVDGRDEKDRIKNEHQDDLLPRVAA